MIRITEAHDLRERLFERLTADDKERSKYAAQHDVWPCVRKGAAERWLRDRGERFPPSRSSALYFLRGKSAEAIIAGTDNGQEMFIYAGVSHHPDLNRAALERIFEEVMAAYPDVKFGEIKSTNFSSFAFYELVKRGGLDYAMRHTFKMRSYIEQCGNYAVALGSPRCVLIVYFLHGDYADRRTKCPACGGRLGEFVDDFYKLCSACGYKSKKMDLWIYILDFDAATLTRIEEDVYQTRVPQFYAAISAADEAGVRAAAPPTPCYYCKTCKVGTRIGCPNAGIEFD